jgi:hypothetical protein
MRPEKLEKVLEKLATGDKATIVIKRQTEMNASSFIRPDDKSNIVATTPYRHYEARDSARGGDEDGDSAILSARR